MSDLDIKIQKVKCELALAKYWGTCSETLINAIAIMRKNPKVSIETALKKGFKRTHKSLLPMPS